MIEAELLRRRLLFVVGKGGVGKTTVASALALESARSGSKTLLVEVDGVGRAAQLLGVPPAEPGEAREVSAGLHLMDVEGSAALAEYLAIIIPVKRVIRGVIGSRIYQHFVAAAPGLKELMTIGKIWYEAQRADDGTGETLWDLVIVDAPATGHSLQYLSMPQAAFDTFGSGLVRREAKRIIDVLQDPKQTAVVLVTTAEEMPVNETLQTYQRLCGELHLTPGALIVNRVHEPSLRPDDVSSLEHVLGSAGRLHARAFLEEVARRGHEECGWIGINRDYLARLATAIDCPTVVLPFLFREEFGLAEIKTLAAALHRAERPRSAERAR